MIDIELSFRVMPKIFNFGLICLLIIQLTVEYTLYQSETVNGDLCWPNEDEDSGVELIITLIKQKHRFNSHTWPVHGLPCSPNEPPSVTVPEPEEAQSAGKDGVEFVEEREPKEAPLGEDDDVEFLGSREPNQSQTYDAGCVGDKSEDPKSRLRAEKNPIRRKPFTRSAGRKATIVDPPPTGKKKPISKTKHPQPKTSAAAGVVKHTTDGGEASQTKAGNSTSQFVTHAEFTDLKSWFAKQLVELRCNISADIMKNLEDKSQKNMRGNTEEDKPECREKEKTEMPESRKRKREDYASLSSGISSSSMKNGLSDRPNRKDCVSTVNLGTSDGTWELYGSAKTISEVLPS